MLERGSENKVGLDNIIIEAEVEEERAHRVHGSATGGCRASLLGEGAAGGVGGGWRRIGESNDQISM